MFDIGWQEFFLVAVVAVIVIGPKELPRTLRAIYGVIRKGRMIAQEFQSGLDDMVRQADLDDVRKEFSKAKDELTGISDTAEELAEESREVREALEFGNFAPENAAAPTPKPDVASATSPELPSAPSPVALPGSAADTEQPAETKSEDVGTDRARTQT